MGLGTPQRAFVTAVCVAVVATAALTAWIGLGIAGRAVTVYVDDVATVVAALAATVFCAIAARSAHGNERRLWSLLAIAAGLWALAEITWGIYELALHREVPVPSWADIGYLGAIPFAVAGLASHPATGRSATRTARYVFDGLLIASALLFLSWSLVLEPLGQMTDAGTAEGIVSLAYPFGDVVILFFVVLAIRGMRSGNRVSLWCLLGGLVAMALADSAYAAVVAHGYETGQLMDVGWIVGYIGIALGAIGARVPAPAVDVAESRPPTLAVLAAPFLLVLAALTVAAAQMEAGAELGTVALVMLGALIALVFGRQALLCREYMSLSGTGGSNASERLIRAAAGQALREAFDARY
jgi:diguanylate cyclase